jgi:hypothetical protein
MDQNELPPKPCHLGVQSDASNTISEPTVCSDEDIISSKMTMPTTSIPKVQPFYMRLIIDAFDELMLHHDVCSFSFSELLTWINGRFDCIWKAWKVNEVDWGPNPSIPNVLR